MKKILLRYFKKFTGPKKKAIVAALLIIGGFFAWKISRKEEKPQIQTVKVEKGTIVSSITASGNIISSNIENVTTQASGTVSKVYVSDGNKVYTGQKLAEIDLDVQGDQNYISAYSSYVSAVNSLNSAKNSYRSTQASLAVIYDEIQGHDNDETLEMKETRTRAEVANDNAYDAIKAAELRLSSASLSLKTSSPVITAPVPGTVKSVTIAEGMNIGASETASGSRANQKVATIATGGLPIAKLNVSEIDVSSIKPGQKATVTLDAIVDKTFTGSVVSVDRVGATTNNVTTYPVIIQFDTSSDQILPNMAATANIIVQTKANVLVVPSTAINYQGDSAFVTIMREGQEISQPVEVGISDDIQVEITSGLSEGDTVITGSISTTSSMQSQRNGGFFTIPGGGVRMMR